MSKKTVILAWFAAIFAVALSGLAILQPLLYRWVFQVQPPKGSMDFAILGAMIGLITLGVTAFGIGIYRILKDQIESDAAQAARREVGWGTAVSLNASGSQSWIEYYERKKRDVPGLSPVGAISNDRTGLPDWNPDDRVRMHLDMAIELTSNAEHQRKHIDETDPDQELLYATIVNNLAYYLAEQERRQYRHAAETFASYLEARLDQRRFVGYVDAWTDTIDKVRKCQWRGN